MRSAERSLRRLMLLIAVSSVAGPLAVTLWTYRDAGVIWQGRYGLPFSLGLVVLAGLALERLGPLTLAAHPWLLGGLSLVGVGQVVNVLSVLDSQSRESPSVALGLWHVPSPWLVGTVASVGWAVMSLALVVWLRAALPERKPADSTS